jgi:D-glycerate 3-kinase
MAEISTGLAIAPERLLVLGICGTQASGKSTLCADIVRECNETGIAAATLSLDDIYMTSAERAALARDVHPLLATRGVPGTHDVALGLSVIEQLSAGDALAMPRFDKGRDDRAPQSEWPLAPLNCKVLLFEGWCMGAVPQAEAALVEPVNWLEAEEDPQGVWRSHANRALGGEYRGLFARVDRLIMLEAPGFEVVQRWRTQQEQAIPAERRMDDAALARFIAHYERLTRHILAEMPDRADCVIRLGQDRGVLGIRQSQGGLT